MQEEQKPAISIDWAPKLKVATCRRHKNSMKPHGHGNCVAGKRVQDNLAASTVRCLEEQISMQRFSSHKPEICHLHVLKYWHCTYTCIHIQNSTWICRACAFPLSCMLWIFPFVSACLKTVCKGAGLEALGCCCARKEGSFNPKPYTLNPCKP